MSLSANFIYAGLITACKILTSLIILKIIAVYYGADGLGYFGQITSIFILATLITSGGIANGLTKTSSEINSKKKLFDCLSFMVFVTLILLIPGGLIYTYLIYFSNSIINYKVGYAEFILSLFFIPIAAISLNLKAILFGMGKIAKVFKIELLSTIFIFVIILIGSYFYTISLFYIVIIQYSVFFIIILIVKFPEYTKNKLYYCIRFIDIRKNISIYSLYGLAALIAGVSQNLLQIYIRSEIGSNSGWIDAGYWQGVIRITDVYFQILSILGVGYLIPQMAKKNETVITRKYQIEIILKILALIVAIQICIYIFRFPIVNLVLNESFYGAIDLFPIQLAADFFKSICYLFGFVAISKGDIKYLVLSEPIQAILIVSILYSYDGHIDASIVCLSYLFAYIIFSIISFIYWYFSND